MSDPYMNSLRHAIMQRHGCACHYAQTVLVKEVLNRATVWEGNVEVFDLADHFVAQQCYAWRFEDDGGRRQFVTILKAPPVDSAEKAVHAFTLSRQK